MGMVWPLSSDKWKAPYIRKGYYFVMKRYTKEVLSALSKMVYMYKTIRGYVGPRVGSSPDKTLLSTFCIPLILLSMFVYTVIFPVG